MKTYEFILSISFSKEIGDENFSEIVNTILERLQYGRQNRNIEKKKILYLAEDITLKYNPNNE